MNQKQTCWWWLWKTFGFAARDASSEEEENDNFNDASGEEDEDDNLPNKPQAEALEPIHWNAHHVTSALDVGPDGCIDEDHDEDDEGNGNAENKNEKLGLMGNTCKQFKSVFNKKLCLRDQMSYQLLRKNGC